MFDRLTMVLPTDKEEPSTVGSVLDRISMWGNSKPVWEPDGPCFLLGLPHEVLERILLLADNRSILNAIQTCRTLKAVSESPAVQYRLILERAGYIDCPHCPRPTKPEPSETDASRGKARRSPHTGRLRPTIPSVTLADWPAEPVETVDLSTLSASDKAKLLRAREDRWDALDAGQVRTFQVSGHMNVYELQEGILLVCESLTTHHRPRVVRLIPLPSVTDPDLEDPIIPTKANKVDFQIADLTMDPTQDLIVVSELDPRPERPGQPAPAHKLHLLALSTFEPHPLAARAVLDFPPVDVPAIMPRQLLQVLGDTLVVLVSREGANMLQQADDLLAVFGIDMEEELVAWNWKTGEVLARIHLGRSASECSFVMLTETTVAVAMPAVVESLRPVRTAPPMIQIFSFAQRNPGVKVEQPLTFNRLDDTTPRAVPVAKLLIPALADGAGLYTFHMRPDPAFPPQKEAPLASKPFTQDPGKGVIVCDLVVASATAPHTEFHPQFFDFFILREYLIQLAEEGEARRRVGWEHDLSERAAQRTIFWEDWGEENSRMLVKIMDPPRQLVCSCSGYRYVSMINSRSPSEYLNIVIQDFNPHTIARERARRRAEGQGTGWVQSDDGEYQAALWDRDEPTEIAAEPAWRNKVVTKLPFRTVQRPFKATGKKPKGIMMDAERVMLIASYDEEVGTITQEITTLCM